MNRENAGKRIHLYQMAGEADMMDMDGTIEFEDGIGQIHVKWDNGRSLAVSPEEDEYEIIEESKKIKGFQSFVNENSPYVLKDDYDLPYNDNRRSKTIFIQDNMEMLGDTEIDAMIKLITDNVDASKLIDNEL
jgi:hypothetical protein